MIRGLSIFHINYREKISVEDLEILLACEGKAVRKTLSIIN